MSNSRNDHDTQRLGDADSSDGGAGRADKSIDRRKLLAGVGLGAAVVGGVAGAASASASGSSGVEIRKETVTFDVACIGDTWRDSPVRDQEPGDYRGTPFMVEGFIYPEGTVQPNGFVPSDNGAIGHWFCRGFLLIHSQRPEPHLASVQEYQFGRISESNLFPADSITTSGIEGTVLPEPVMHRAVVGGTGIYRAATGELTQTNLGFNTSLLRDGSGDAAPNFRCQFDLFLMS